jgi:CHAT domain-containing protein/tetratricopeptide (TPR) repeat protein
MAPRQLVLTIVALAVVVPEIALAQRPLSLDDDPNREEILYPGQSQAFTIALQAGEFARLSVEPLFPEADVVLQDPDGKEILNRTRNHLNKFAESLSLIAPAEGSYRLIVSSHWPQPGRYVVRIMERRPSIATDRVRIEAERIYDETNEVKKARTPEDVRRVIPRFERAMQLFGQLHDDAALADAETRLGEAKMYFLGEYEAGLPHLFHALAIRQCIDDASGRGQALDEIGASLRMIGQPRKALPFLRAALAYRNPEIPREVAVTLRNIADAQQMLGENPVPVYLRVLSLMTDANEPIGQGYVHHSLAYYYLNRGDWPSSLEHARESLRVFRAAKHDRGVVGSLTGIGMAYQGEGDPERALEYLKQAMSITNGFPDPRYKAEAAEQIGSVFYDLRQYDRAIDYQHRALAIFSRLEHGITEIEVLIELGESYAGKGDAAKAIVHYEKAMSIMPTVQQFGIDGMCYRAMAEAQLRLGKLEAALSSASRAVEILSGSGYDADEVSALVTRARVRRTGGELEAAREDAEAAMGIIEKLRGKIPTIEKRATFLASVWDAYELDIDVLMRLHREDLALHASERARARSLVDLLTESRAGAVAPQKRTQLARVRLLRDRISMKAQAQLQLAAEKNNPLASQIKSELEDLNAQYEQLIARMRREDPALAAMASPEPLTLEQIQREVVDPSSALLEYSLGETRSFLWVVTPGSLHTYVLPPRSRIESAVRSAYRALSTSAPAVQTLRQLSAMILAPASVEIRAKRLIIVPDGALQYLSFASLLTPGSGRPLIADHEIVTLPSASAIAVLRRYPRPRETSRTLAVFADPVFDRRDPRLFVRGAQLTPSNMDSDLARSVRESGLRDLSRLPFTRREATAILSLVEPSLRKGALDFDANRRAVMDPDLVNYRFVHFATHGLLNNFHPELSGIVLSMVDASGRSQEGFLSTADVFNLSWNTDLVVLSGCRTGLGKEIRGEGIAGLTQAFMYAGATRVVASLWNVNDAATAALMKKFYQEMLGPKHLAPGAALRAAQLSLQKTKRWSAPYYWAGFVMQGEWR